MPYYPPLSQLIAGGFQILFNPAVNRLVVIDPNGVECWGWDINGNAIVRGTDGITSEMTFGRSIGQITRYSLGVLANAAIGVPPIRGLDNRSGITAADGAPITLYAVPNTANLLFRISIEIVATAFTSGTATYTVTWTENGVSQTAVVTATALNVVTGIVRLMMPDANTNVTVQLTGAFVATVRISSVVEQLSA